MDISGKLLGGSFTFKKNGEELKNVKVLKLSISTGRFAGVGVEDFHSKFKPSIRIEGFRIVGFNTLNTDRTKFDIPLCCADEKIRNTVIININWIKRNSKAEFIIVGHAERGVAETNLEATLFPGLGRDVSISYSPTIIKREDKTNFKPGKLDTVYESI